jgi:hypothetical protein
MGMLVSAGCGVLLSGLCGVLFKALLYQIRLPVFVIVILCLAYMCLWSPSRGKNAGPVKSLVVRSMNGSTVLFAFLEDGTLRVWDLLTRHRLLNYSLSSLLELEGRSLSPCLLYVPISLCSYGQDGIRYCGSLMSRVFVSLGYEGLLLLVSYCGCADVFRL